MKSLHYNSAGQMVPLGNITRTKTADFDDGTLNWLTAAAGTSSVATGTVGKGVVTMTTAATASASAMLQSTWPVLIGQAQGILWEVNGFSQNSAGAALTINIGIREGTTAPSGAGVYAMQTGTDTFFKLFKAGESAASGVDTVQNSRTGSGATVGHNLALLYAPPSGELTLFKDGSIVGTRVMGAYQPNNAVKPYIQLITPDAVARSFYVMQCKQTVWINNN